MRFRKSVKVMPGVRLNFSKSGVSTSIGGRGGTVNLSRRGVRSTASIPGTGLSWSSKSGWAEDRRSNPIEEVDNLRRAALEAISGIVKEADKANGAGVRIDRAIDTLNGGRGLTASKAQTFEKRVLTEEGKIFEMKEEVREGRLFLKAIEQRLQSMRFGWFSGSAKRHRDGVLAAVEKCSAEAETIEKQLAKAHQSILAKLTEVQERLSEKSSIILGRPSRHFAEY